MRNLGAFLLISLLSTPFTILAQTATHLWSHQFGSTGMDFASDVATNDAGDVYVTGSFEGTVNFSGTNLTSSGGTDMFLAKYDGNGVLQWIHRYGGVANDFGSDIELDEAGNIVLLAQYVGTVNMGGSDFNTPQIAPMLAKFDGNGSHIQSRGFVNANGTFGAAGIALGASGEIVMPGMFFGAVDFGGGQFMSLSPDIYIAKYDANLVHQWSESFGGADLDLASAVTVDPLGDIVVTGKFAYSIDFGGGPLVSEATSMYLVKFTAGGVHVWSHSYDGNGNAGGSAITLDGSNNLLVGVFGDPVLGAGPLIGNGTRTLYAMFDADGNHQWTRAYEGAGQAIIRSMSSTHSGGVAVIGGFYGDADIGGGLMVNPDDVSTLATNVFVAVYDAAGEHRCSRGMGGIRSDSGRGIAVDMWDDVYAVGGFRLSIDTGDGEFVSAGGQSDAFFAKYRCAQPVPVLVQRFDAVARAGAVELRWEVWSDEFVDRYEITRTDVAAVRSESVAHDVFAADVTSFVDTSVRPGTSYEYVLSLYANGQVIAQSPVAAVTTPTMFASIGQNYPNPFNPSTAIDVTITERSRIAVEIYDARGVHVATLDAGTHEAGTHRVEWNGADATGRRVGSGVYFYRLNGHPGWAPRKMVLMK